MSGSPWQVLFCDFLSDTDLDILEVQELEFDSRIIVPGSFKCKLPIPNGEARRRARRVFPDERLWPPPAGEGRVVAHVFRDEALTDEWDAYQLWEAPVTGNEDDDGAFIEIVGASLDSYAFHRQIWNSLRFDQVDQVDIALALMADMQFEVPGDPAILLSGDPSGVLRDRAYLASEAATYGDRLVELANVQDGFEYRTQAYVNGGGHRVREFVAAYPKLDPGPIGELALQRPGNLLGYTYHKSALDAAIRWRTRGDTVNDDVTADSEPLMSDIMVAQEFIDAGWPYLDRTIDRQGVTELATLNDYALWYRQTRSGVIRVPEVTGILTPEMPIHPRRLGGTLDVTIVDEWFAEENGAPTMEALWRMVGIGVKPGLREGADVMEIIFAEGVRD